MPSMIMMMCIESMRRCGSHRRELAQAFFTKAGELGTRMVEMDKWVPPASARFLFLQPASRRPYFRISGQMKATASTMRMVPTPPETTEKTGPNR